MNQVAYKCDVILVARRRLGKTQKQIAALLEVTPTTISRVEKGRAASYKILQQLSTALNVPMAEIIDLDK